MQFQLTLEPIRCGGMDGLKGAGCKGEGGKVAFADRSGSTIHLALCDFTAIRMVTPALTGRYHIAMGIERNRWAA